MKSNKLLFACLLLLFAAKSHATLCSAVANGNWSSPATWSCGRVPQSNDTMWIPVGFTVQVDINSPVYANMLIIIDGNLFFDVGQKINICPGGVYISPTGSMGGGNPGSKVNICGSTVWNGPEVISGPASFGTVVLPVELISFTGTLQSTGFVLLEWETASETNNSHFTIERSVDGFTFEEIGRVGGRGNSSQISSYLFTDTNPGTGTIYYRLRQTDYNGRFEYIGTIAVEVITDPNGCVLTAFPNPCEGACTVNFSECSDDNTATLTVEVIDAYGQVVSRSVPQRNSNGGFTAVINADHSLNPGVYFIRVATAKAVYTERLIVQ